MDKTVKRILKKLNKQKPAAPMLSLMDDLHVHYDDNYESWYEYGFYDPEDYSDDELDDLLRQELGREYIWTPYDCTGQAFTSWIHWHRCPNGMISVVHRVCLDV